MKKILLRALLLMVLPFIVTAIESCCYCDDPGTYYYTYQGFTISNVDNSAAIPREVNEGEILNSAFALRLKFDREKIACASFPRISIFAPAMATSCDCPSVTILPQERVNSVKVYTLNDFDANHHIDDDVTGYFRIFDQSTYKNIDDFFLRFDYELYDDGQLDTDYDLLLMTPPTIGIEHQFRVVVEFSDGRVEEHQTTPISLVNE